MHDISVSRFKTDSILQPDFLVQRIIQSLYMVLGVMVPGRVSCSGTRADPDLFFLTDEGREDPNITINRPSSARQRNVILMAFRWRAVNGPSLNADFQEIWT